MSHNQVVGAYGEKLAQDYLEKRGYKIIAKNIKTSYKELDIVAQEKNILVFVEVKTRASLAFGEADESLGHRKIISLKRAISIYLNQFNKFNFKDLRLDLIAIDIDKVKKIAKIKHYKSII